MDERSQSPHIRRRPIEDAILTIDAAWELGVAELGVVANAA